MKDGRYWLCEVIGINYKSVVMSTMGKLQIMLLFLVAVFSGCSETDERAYVGKNSIYIRTEGDPVILAMDDEPLKATLMLIRAYDKDVSFEIDVKYLTEGAGDLVTVNPAIVTIPAGEKSVDFEIISNKKGVVADKVQLEIGVKYPLPEADMGKVEEVLRVVVKPYMEAEDLTEEQQALLEGYKAKGLDLSKWIGVIPVKVSVEVPPTDGLESLINGMKKVYTGKTVVTLSEDATAEQPILKMTNNPMGLTEFMYDMLRKETVENDMFWYYDPGEGEINPYMAMMELIGLSKTSLETFEMTLDNIRVDFPNNGVSNVEFLGERPDIWDETESRQLSEEECSLLLNLLMVEESMEAKQNKQRHQEGVAQAKNSGKYAGRKRIVVDPNLFRQVAEDFRNHKVTEEEAMHRAGIRSRSTFYRRLKEI